MIVGCHQLAQHCPLALAQARRRTAAQGFGHSPPLSLGGMHPVLHRVERDPKAPGQPRRGALTLLVGHQNPLAQIRRIGKRHDTLPQHPNPVQEDAGPAPSFRHAVPKTALMVFR